jgi:hypothetical protein
LVGWVDRSTYDERSPASDERWVRASAGSPVAVDPTGRTPLADATQPLGAECDRCHI